MLQRRQKQVAECRDLDREEVWWHLLGCLKDIPVARQIGVGDKVLEGGVPYSEEELGSCGSLKEPCSSTRSANFVMGFMNKTTF